MSINFVEKDRRRIERTQRQDKRVFWLFLVLVIVALAILAVLLAVQLFFRQQNNQVQAEIERHRRQIILNEDMEADYLVFYHKLETLARILDMRHNHTYEAVWGLSHFEGQQIRVRSIQYDLLSRELRFVLQAYSIFYFQEVLDALARSQVQERYLRVENGLLQRDSDGYYNLTVFLGLQGPQ
jgi:cell division protein FtsL